MKKWKDFCIPLFVFFFLVVSAVGIGYAGAKETWVFVTNEDSGVRVFTQAERAAYADGNGSGVLRLDNPSKELYALYAIEFRDREDGTYGVTLSKGRFISYEGDLLSEDGGLTFQIAKPDSAVWKACRTIERLANPPKKNENTSES